MRRELMAGQFDRNPNLVKPGFYDAVAPLLRTAYAAMTKGKVTLALDWKTFELPENALISWRDGDRQAPRVETDPEMLGRDFGNWKSGFTLLAYKDWMYAYTGRAGEKQDYYAQGIMNVCTLVVPAYQRIRIMGGPDRFGIMTFDRNLQPLPHKLVGPVSIRHPRLRGMPLF